MPTKTVPISGNTYAVRAELKALGGRWNAPLKCWDVPEERANEARALVLSEKAKDDGFTDVSMRNYRKAGKSYLAQCPVCDFDGKRSSRHLSIKIADPSVYHCWRGCEAEDIKAALGFDPHARIRFTK